MSRKRSDSLRPLTPEQSIAAFKRGDEMWLEAYQLIQRFGPLVLKALQEGQLQAYFVDDAKTPLVKGDEFMEWMVEDRDRLDKLERWSKRH